MSTRLAVVQDALVQQLGRARELGFLGPGAVEDHIAHAVGFVNAVMGVHGRVVDLGSGGGVPGLVLATVRPDLEVVLVDAMAKRCAFLEQAVDALGLGTTRVIHGRAEVLGRTELRGRADAVVARGFGSPAVTAECAAPLLRIGGRLVVSEPPSTESRWWAEPLEALGLRLGPRSVSSPVMQVLLQVGPCPDQFPRRDGMPRKRPLF
ncbi:MAG: RsmG family class I SAM-dependent methyltransferase [Acidimicrobiales bacterium]